MQFKMACRSTTNITFSCATIFECNSVHSFQQLSQLLNSIKIPELQGLLIQMLQLSDWAHKHTSCTFQTERHPFALDVLTLSHGLSTTPPTQVWHGKFGGDVGWIIWLVGAAARWWVTGDLSVIDKAIRTLWLGRVSATWSWLATCVTFS